MVEFLRQKGLDRLGAPSTYSAGLSRSARIAARISPRRASTAFSIASIRLRRSDAGGAANECCSRCAATMRWMSACEVDVGVSIRSFTPAAVLRCCPM